MLSPKVSVAIFSESLKKQGVSIIYRARDDMPRNVVIFEAHSEIMETIAGHSESVSGTGGALTRLKQRFADRLATLAFVGKSGSNVVGLLMSASQIGVSQSVANLISSMKPPRSGWDKDIHDILVLVKEMRSYMKELVTAPPKGGGGRGEAGDSKAEEEVKEEGGNKADDVPAASSDE